MAPKRSMKAKLVAGEGPLSRVPPLAAFVVVAAMFVVGVLVGGLVGALLFGALVLGIAIMLAVTWGALTPSQRFARVLVLGILVGVAVSVVLEK